MKQRKNTKNTYEQLSSQYADVNKNGVCDEGEPIVSYTYDSYGKIIGVETESTAYTFTYNTANLPVSVYVEGQTSPLVTYLYDEKLVENTGVRYANGLTVSYQYDTIGNVRKVLENGEIVAEYQYDSNMNVISAVENGAKTVYSYDPAGGLQYTTVTRDGHTVTTYSETDAETGDVDYVTVVDGAQFVSTSVYDEENDISKYVLPNLAEITSDEDDFGRTSHVYLKDSAGNNILSCTYGYVDKQTDAGLATSEYISSMSYTNGKTYTCTYDAVGNITSVSDGTNTTSYEYDSLYQLTRENNQKAGKTWTYTYDTAGNILSKSEYAYTTGELGTAIDTVTYTYNSTWGDKLLSYDGTEITYDAQGNPLTWREGYEFTWKGRQLHSIYDEYNNATLTYTYNDDGIRTKKHWQFEDDSTETIEYILDDNNTLVKQVYTYQYPDDEPEVETIYYFYDETGSPAYLTYNGTNLYYVKNLQGDVMGLMTSDGTTVISYEYDAWGNVIDEALNDFDYYAVFNLQVYRYRSYIYDNDTGFYYLQSRYYDPIVGRFINADDTNYLGASGTVLSYNLYAYCENNPIYFIDETGNASVLGFSVQVIGFALRTYNFAHNLRLKFVGYIFTQHSGNASIARMGFYKGSYNGCGWIATYNACIMLGMSTHPAYIINYYEKNGMILAGTFGISAASIAQYFRSRGKKVTTNYNSKDKFSLDLMLRNCKAGIICYKLSNGRMHYIAAKWNKSRNTYVVYNYKSTGNGDTYTSLQNELFRNNWCGYIAFIGIS